jgi:hypothetical protein
VKGLARLFVLASVGAVACGDASQAPAQRLWTMADLQLSSHQGTSCTNPGGLPCTYFVDRGADQVRDVLQFKLAFGEGNPIAYMTTDFWANYDRIWLEPMYLLVTAWNQDAPAANRLTKDGGGLAGPIFSVGPASKFYSPYWQIFYVEVPPGTPATKYISARQLFDDGLVMHAGPNRFASIGPASVSLPSAADMTYLFSDLQNYLAGGTTPADLVASSQALTGWLDGAPVAYVDFGNDNFDADANRVILDVPLFLFEQADDHGVFGPMGAPNVAGVAPLFSQSPGLVSPTHRPRFGALWRLHVVLLPRAAAMFTVDAATTLINAGGDAATIRLKVRRVALDGSCFADLNAFGSCVWLDSQAALEANLGQSGLVRTGLQPACPFVMYGGYAVPHQ